MEAMNLLSRHFIAVLWLLSPGTGLGADAKVELAGRIFDVHTAVTPKEWSRGLQHRAHMAANEGMLFIYPKAHRLSFWMKDTLLPLDILFFDSDGALINVYHDVQPCRSQPCPIYPSGGPAQYVLEFNAGTAAALRVKPGDNFTIIP